MKQLKFFSFLLFILFISLGANAQFSKLKEKIKQKIEQRVDEKTDKAIDKTLDNAEKQVQGDEEQKANNNSSSNSNENKTGAGLKAYSRFDFVPGDKIIYAEDFSQDVVGEMPVKWKTNGSGEIMTIDNLSGKWLNLKEQTYYTAPFKTALPENYTLEFDLLADYKDDQRVPRIVVDLIKPLGVDNSGGESFNAINGIALKLKPNGGNNTTMDAVSMDTYDGKGKLFFAGDKDNLTNIFNDFNKKVVPIHVALWAQGSRIRVWLNQEKVYDNPTALEKGTSPSQLKFDVGSYGGPQNNYHYYLSNIKIAAAAPDTRNKLITEGKFSTTGILFDVNSDKIKPVSYGTLKEIAGVLNDNPTVKVKIIGHTDSDGDAAKNLDLSKRRAASVKQSLATDFKIEPTRMETDGMGATKPVGDNKTQEGKAQNRRVEFVKI